MRKPIVCLIGILALGLSFARAAEDGWRQLPLVSNGKLDPNWVHIGYGGWAVEDGGLRTEPAGEGLGLLVYKKEKLGNCQIRVVFKPRDARSNSGVYVRIADGVLDQIKKPGAKFDRDAAGKISDPSMAKMKESGDREEGPWYAVHQGYEVQIAGNSSGSIYSLAPTAVKTDEYGKWRTMVITLKGDQITVDLDGQRASDVNTAAANLPPRKQWHEPKRDAKRPHVGYIGLQTHDPGDVVTFKEISVRPLPTAK